MNKKSGPILSSCMDSEADEWILETDAWAPEEEGSEPSTLAKFFYTANQVASVQHIKSMRTLLWSGQDYKAVS